MGFVTESGSSEHWTGCLNVCTATSFIISYIWLVMKKNIKSCSGDFFRECVKLKKDNWPKVSN